jgi:hypothetical protein
MDLLDKVLLEWSARTDKGYPDLNDEQDLALFESMFGFDITKLNTISKTIDEATEESDIDNIRRNLLNIIKNIDDPSELTKITKYASNLGFGKSIDKHLESKNLSRK